MKKLIGLIVAVLMSCPGLGLAGEDGNTGQGGSERTTVKSSKSNSSERTSQPSAGKNDAAGQAGSAGIAVSDEGVPADKKSKSNK